MLSLNGRAVQWASRHLGFPPGTGEMIPTSARKRLLASLLGAIGLSVLDMIGVLAMLPMMQYVTGQDSSAGALGRVDSLLGHPSSQVLVGSLALIIVGTFVVKDICALLFRRWQLSFMAEHQVEISTKLLEGYLTGPYAWHLTKNTSDKLWTIQGAVGAGYIGGLSSALAVVTEVMTVTFIFISLLFISPVATLAALVYFGMAALVVQRMIRPRILRASQQLLEASQSMSKASLQSLTAVKEIKLRNAHGPFVSTFSDASRTGARAGVSAALLNEVPKYFLEIVFFIGVGLLAVGATSSSSPEAGITLLGIFVAAGTRILPSSVRLINAIAGIRFARSPLEHLVQEHRWHEDARRDQLNEIRTTDIPTGDLEIRGVTFAYADRPDELVLRGVDLDIGSGESVAIVGSSGAGKSTLVDLVLGLHRPLDGTIVAGDTNVFHNLPGWQRQLAVVPQDVTLLDESLGANIAFDEDVDDERLHQAIERAQLGDLVRSLPDGLSTTVGERGARLSGGQRQRIGIARALYRQPRLLVLDEATSALDNETERKLTATIESLKGSMTMIIVAHRLSTVRHCDKLVFMSHGLVESTGTFDEVRRQNEEFAHLVDLGSLPGAAP